MDPYHKAMATSQAPSCISLTSALPSTGLLLSFAPIPAAQTVAPISGLLFFRFIFQATLGTEVQKGRAARVSDRHTPSLPGPKSSHKEELGSQTPPNPPQVPGFPVPEGLWSRCPETLIKATGTGGV